MIVFRSEVVTRGIRVAVVAQYVPERSDPSEKHWFFAYRIRVSNEGEETAQLVSRHWIITDADGHVEEVRGPGVVGEQPVLEPGQAFEYTSFCPLPTAFGAMQGTYQMVLKTGEPFDAEIAAFTMAQTPALN